MNAWLPQASYPCGNFSDTSCLKLVKSKRIDRPRFLLVCIRTENQNQVSFCPFALREVSVLAELTLGHLRYLLTDVPPQSNSPPDTVFRADRGRRRETSPLGTKKQGLASQLPLHWISKETIKVVVFQLRLAAPTYATPLMSLHKVGLESSSTASLYFPSSRMPQVASYVFNNRWVLYFFAHIIESYTVGFPLKKPTVWCIKPKNWSNGAREISFSANHITNGAPVRYGSATVRYRPLPVCSQITKLIIVRIL